MASAAERTAVRRRRDEIVRQAFRAGDAATLLAGSAARLRELVPHDAAAWLMTDPSTGLPTAPSWVVGFDASAGLCSEHWHHELVVDDVIRFRDLARAEKPASSLRASAPVPETSSRYRTFLQPYGFADELRTVLHVGDAPWASVTLWRREGQPLFTGAETDLVADLSGPLGEALRLLAQPHDDDDLPVHLVGQDRPGVLHFDVTGEVVAADAQAALWVADLPPDRLLPTDVGFDVPVWLVMLAMRARWSLRDGGDGTARTRVRSSSGAWLVCHASCTWGRDGTATDTVVVIERANPSQVAPILATVYGLTEREQQVTRLIARGHSTREMAGALHLSPHTVKDHVKAILAKVGVPTRGELVARLYADHYEPVHLAYGHRPEQTPLSP
jgi:DNA-binding CsgD family transcriptional regulator